MSSKIRAVMAKQTQLEFALEAHQDAVDDSMKPASDIEGSANKVVPKTKAKAKAKAQAEPQQTDDDAPNSQGNQAQKKPASAKVKAKAKAKASAKGKTKPKAKATKARPLKRKLDDDEDDDEKGNEPTQPAAKPKPKPAAKPKVAPAPAGTLRDLKKRLLENADAALLSQDEDDDHEGEAAADRTDEAIRDRCKSNKFEHLMQLGKLPAHIIKAYEEGMKLEKQPRKFKTKFVNNLFERNPNGQLVMMPNAPMFEAWKETSTTKNFHDKQAAMPKRVFKGKYFGNSEEALNEAIAAEEVKVMHYEGKDWCVFRTLELDQLQGKTHKQKFLQTQSSLNKTDCQTMTTAFDDVDFDFSQYLVKQPSASSSSAASSQQLAIADAPKGIPFNIYIYIQEGKL